MSEAWVTDDDLRSARERFAAQIPGLVIPVAYSVARQDASGLTFGHVNTPGAVRPLPAVVLASVCGYVATTGVYRLDQERFAEAVERLTPAEAATHIPHPNRAMLETCGWPLGGVPSQGIRMKESSRPALERGSGRYACAHRSHPEREHASSHRRGRVPDR